MYKREVPICIQRFRSRRDEKITQKAWTLKKAAGIILSLVGKPKNYQYYTLSCHHFSLDKDLKDEKRKKSGKCVILKHLLVFFNVSILKYFYFRNVSVLFPKIKKKKNSDMICFTQ